MAMRNNLNSPLKTSIYKQVKRSNGKYTQILSNSGVSKCDICGKNFLRMKLFDHIKEIHRQYFCMVCRDRFRIHKDLISHLQDIHHLVASDDLNKAQDIFSDSVNKRYFATPLIVPRLPIPSINNPQESSSSSEDDELFFDDTDVLDIVLGSKNCEEHKEENEVVDIINNIIINVTDDIKAEELFENTLQDLSCSDVSVTDESDNLIVNKLIISKHGGVINSSIQTNSDSFPCNNLNILENEELSFEKGNTMCKPPTIEELESLPSLNNVEEEFKLRIQSMSNVLSEKSPWVNGPDTLHNVNDPLVNHSDLVTMALTLDNKLEDMHLNVILKECIRTSCLTCVYCHNSTCIAVNGKQLALHMIENHRFMTVKNESSEDVANILKSNLVSLDNVYLNSENFDSTDELSHTPFNNNFYCFNCQFTSKQMKEVNSHKRSIHSRKTYDCIMCKITFSNYGELHCHLCPGADLGVWQNLSFRCLFCGLGQIPSAFRCMVHLRKAHNACDYCLETFSNQQSLALHVNKHKMKHMCLKCNITYLSKKDIFEHMFWKHNRDSKECKLCLTKKWPYTYHFCVPPAIFSCEECKRTFSNALLLKVHERWHTGNVPYECNTCHYKFISKKLLMKHEIIHKEVISPVKKKKKKKKKKGDDYNLPPLNLSSDSDTEKTPRHKSERYTKSPSPSSSNYWDYVSKQKKELVHIALLDHDYTLLSTSQSEVIKSPPYQDESIPVINGSENVLNSSFNKSCHRSSCSSHCNSSSSSSSSCGSDCSCSASFSSSSDSETEEKKKPIIESPKKHKKKKKEKKVKVLSEKKIAKFNLCALETDLESEFLDTDNEEFYDINPVPLHPEVNTLVKDNLRTNQESNNENISILSETINSVIPHLTIPNDNFELSLPLSKSNQYTNIDSHILRNNEEIGLSHYESKTTNIYNTNTTFSTKNSSSFYENVMPAKSQESIKNNLSKSSLEVCNGNYNLHGIQNELNSSVSDDYDNNDSYYSTPRINQQTKRKFKFKTLNKNSSLPREEVEYTSQSLLNSSPHSTCTTNQSTNVMSPNDTRQSKRQPKKRKFFGYDSSDEEHLIPNGNVSLVQQISLQPSISSSSKKKKQKRKSKPESPLQHTTTKLIQSQQKRPIVDVRISKTVIHPAPDDTDSDSGNLVIELPKFVEQKAVQSTERLYCHCRCPYDEVSEMIACDNSSCRVEWFHFDCVGITVAPKGNWYCPDCR